MADEQPSQSAASASAHGPGESLNSEMPVQPAFFYPSGHPWPQHLSDKPGCLTPEEDPLASRGIPVFRPTLEEFSDFEQYMTRVEVWGRRSGIVKVIPPQEWSAALPSVNHLLPDVKLKNPIEQHMIGQRGLFRQNNVEITRTLSVKDWAELCGQDDLKAIPIQDGELKTRGIRRASPKKKAKQPRKGKDGINEGAGGSADEARTQTPDSNNSAAAADYPTPLSNPHDGEEAGGDTPDPFYASFDPKSSWLPADTSPEDYTPDVCRELERYYWRTCGIGTPPQYGADMAGSLFTEQTQTWNVANLPSFLSRLCANKALPGVNTPYLYFGMWRATFAWHVEDMDLYSINYIHWGAPKYWYAIPSERSKAFEETMKTYFPGDSSTCPQYLRHKSYLLSPTLLAGENCRPNTLVQHQGEFVITFPRGYHAGFNLGLNCAESVNFALESWAELGRKAGVCNCVGDSVRIDVDALLNPDAHPGPEFVEVEYPELKRAHEESEDEIEGEPVKKKRAIGVSSAQQAPRARARYPPAEAPCCLCASSSTDGLLPVHDPPQTTSAILPTMTQDEHGSTVELWRAHEHCARIIPETWVDEVDGRKVVFGVDGIPKDRWNLKCTECSRTLLKQHGAKVQCCKGKCTKAFHVPCAMAASGVSYKELGEQEKEVILTGLGSTAHAPDAPNGALDEVAAQNVIKTITKPTVEVICSQHNPAQIEKRKEAKNAQVRKDVLALGPEARIRVRGPGGVYEVTVAGIDQQRETVTVLWTDGLRREFAWGRIIWGQVLETTAVQKIEPEASKPGPTGNSGSSPVVLARPSNVASMSAAPQTTISQRLAPSVKASAPHPAPLYAPVTYYPMDTRPYNVSNGSRPAAYAFYTPPNYYGQPYPPSAAYYAQPAHANGPPAYPPGYQPVPSYVDPRQGVAVRPQQPQYQQPQPSQQKAWPYQQNIGMAGTYFYTYPAYPPGHIPPTAPQRQTLAPPPHFQPPQSQSSQAPRS